jgi:hypothetical protein
MPGHLALGRSLVFVEEGDDGLLSFTDSLLHFSCCKAAQISEFEKRDCPLGVDDILQRCS